MALEHMTAHDALLSRADQVIANAEAFRADVRAKLTVSDPWWSMARILISARAIVRGADEALERYRRCALLTIETPLNLIRE